jgi:hypothetical protein
MVDSDLRAVIGSTRAARLAGMYIARRADTISTTETAMRVTGSVGFTS